MKTVKIYQILLMTFFGTFGSILVGFIFFNTSIFISTNTNFQFVMAGLYGSFFFSLLEYDNLQGQLFAIIIILILQLIIFTGRYLSIAYIIRDIFYLGSIFISIKLYHLFTKKNTKIKFYLRSLALVLFLGLSYTIFISMLFLINTNSGYPPIDFIYVIAKSGVLIGLGIGLGLDFYLQNEKHLFNLLKTKTV